MGFPWFIWAAVLATASVKTQQLPMAAQGWRTERNCTYPDVYLPVCGTDDQTYYNDQLMTCIADKDHAKKLTLKFPFPCPCEGILDEAADHPVCGTDNTTYPSKKTLQCLQLLSKAPELAVKHQGVCKGRALDPCWAQDVPLFGEMVCGSDRYTYLNYWHLQCANKQTGKKVKAATEGMCPCQRSLVYRPVCASDGITYHNKEDFECDHHFYHMRNISILKEGYCEWGPATSCQERVPLFGRESRGLCASDGITYLTSQQINCTKQANNESTSTIISLHDYTATLPKLPVVYTGLHVLHDGPCSVAEVSRAVTPEKACQVDEMYPAMAPVCASDGKSYLSYYTFLCATTHNKIELRKAGTCDEEAGEQTDCRVADTTEDPVCGVNNVTYTNVNQLLCAESNITGLVMLHKGPCLAGYDLCRIAINANMMLLPVCASNNVTYINVYAFWCEKQKHAVLEMAHYDECVK